MALGRATNREVLAPIGGRSRIGVHAWLVTVGILQQGEQPIDLGEVFLLGLLDGSLRQIVTEHVLRIDAVHTGLAVLVSTSFFT